MGWRIAGTNKRAWSQFAMVVTAGAMGLVPSRAAAQTYTSIDVPGASETRAHGINDRGEIVGFYRSGSGQPYHGYLLTNDGHFFALNYPGAVETRPQAINAPGDVAGDYSDGNTAHGFIRQRSDGSFMSVDVPGSDLTVIFGINSEGTVIGTYDVAGVLHGFLRSVDGTFVAIDVPGATGTIGGAINERGDITGAYVDSAGREHGFVKQDSDNAFTSFDVPGAVGTEGHWINDRGQIAGVGCTATSCLAPGPQRSYLRSKDGTLTFIDLPGALLTSVSAANNADGIVGDYFDESFVRHGFLRMPR